MSVTIEDVADGGQIALLRTKEDIHDLRDHHPEFTDGAAAVMSFPTADPTIFFNHDNPKAMGFMAAATVGDAVLKDTAGNFTRIPGGGK